MSDVAVLGGDLCSVLAVFGVPTIVILHPLGNCSDNYAVLSDLHLPFQYLLLQSLNQKLNKNLIIPGQQRAR